MRYRYRDLPIRRPQEQPLQEWYALFLHSLGVLHCASAGGMRTSMRTAIKMKRAGYKKGFPDVFIYEPRGQFHGMAVELKLGSYPSAEQKEWQAELLKRGYYAVVVPGKFNYQEAQAFLELATKRYLNNEIE